MISLKYYLSKRKASNILLGEDSRLLMSIHYEGCRIIFYPGIFLNVFHWDKSNQEVVNRTDKDHLNILLRNLKTEVAGIYAGLKNRNEHLDLKIFRNALSEIRVKTHFTLTNAFILFMENKSNSWSNSTYLKFKTLYKKISEYESSHAIYLSLEAADKSFMTDFCKHLMDEGMQISTTETYMNNIKAVLTYAVKKKWMISKDYLNYKPKKSVAEPNHENLIRYLNFQELIELNSLELESRKLQQCRDIFCFMAFTGIRFSEIKYLKVNDLADNSIHIKSKRSRVLPLNKFALAILQKYKNKYYRNNSLLPVYSEITMNKYLAIIFSGTGFTTSFTYMNSERKITISAAYNSFMANAVHLGIDPFFVRKWSANKTLSRYLSVKESMEMREKFELENINQHYKDGK
ncbi:MAG: site-specific integrase [Bacteroidales bacterium]|nr:site-specific integrase [Bacteroidales bacterium]MCF8389471.1 site-specific integrase [Bacteroidales bacterium]